MAKSNPIILKDEEITERMRELPGWKYHDNKLSKEFEFKTFVEGINFINNLTLFCEQIDHHPDMHIFYTKILFELQRFDVGGKVTDLDFEVAKEIEKQYKNL